MAWELERRYEKAIQKLASKPALRNVLQKLDQPLSEGEQQQLKCYAAELETLWHAPSTRAQDRLANSFASRHFR